MRNTIVFTFFIPSVRLLTSVLHIYHQLPPSGFRRGRKNRFSRYQETSPRESRVSDFVKLIDMLGEKEGGAVAFHRLVIDGLEIRYKNEEGCKSFEETSQVCACRVSRENVSSDDDPTFFLLKVGIEKK